MDIGEARKRLRQSYARTGNLAGAFDEFVRAADLLPTDVEVQLDAGNVRLARNQHQEALERADAALRTEPENIEALVLRGNALAGLSSFEQALEAIEQAIRLDPNRGATYVELGEVESAHGRRAEAEAAFLKAVEISPKETSPRLALANFDWSLRPKERCRTSVRRDSEARTKQRACQPVYGVLQYPRDVAQKQSLTSVKSQIAPQVPKDRWLSRTTTF